MSFEIDIDNAALLKTPRCGAECVWTAVPLSARINVTHAPSLHTQTANLSSCYIGEIDRSA